MTEQHKTENREKLACAGMGGGLGLAALAGACSVGCGVAAAPLVGVLSSLGLGAVAAFLPNLRVPFVILALISGMIALRMFARRKNVWGAAVCGCVLGAGLGFLGWQMTRANDCKTASQIETILHQLSPQARVVFQKGVYAIWPELGRAPTIHEVSQRLGYASDETVLGAFGELTKLGIDGIVDPSSGTIRVFWPFASNDHGVEVTLDGMKPVHARCAIDSLGMSAMYGKSAVVNIVSPLDKRQMEVRISGDRIVSASSEMVVSDSDSCDDMLFFASKDEFDRYVKHTGKHYLVLRSLGEALKRGIDSFGGLLKT